MSGISNVQDTDFRIANNHNYLEIPLLITRVRSSIWLIGIPSWTLGITDRSFAAFSDGYLSVVETLQLVAAFLFFCSWLYLKPEAITTEDSHLSVPDKVEMAWDKLHLDITQARKQALQEYHLISQEYTLPFPYLCQIYHLLNLKHLENVHSFSLGNLRILNVNHVEPTEIGGVVRFQTTLDSSLNALRIWRQPVVDAGLKLHTPYTVELTIPAYNGKTITVLFTTLPLNENSHKLFIDIYSDLAWPKPILQAILHFSACLTLFEDLPYLQTLANKNITRLFHTDRVSHHETMWLFRRFVELYGAAEHSFSHHLHPSTASSGQS